MPGGPSEGFAYIITWPLFVITRAITGLVDLVGGDGRQEPFSHYLAPGSIRFLAGVSFLLYFGIVVAVAYALVSIVGSRRRSGRNYNEATPGSAPSKG